MLRLAIALGPVLIAALVLAALWNSRSADSLFSSYTVTSDLSHAWKSDYTDELGISMSYSNWEFVDETCVADQPDEAAWCGRDISYIRVSADVERSNPSEFKGFVASIAHESLGCEPGELNHEMDIDASTGYEYKYLMWDEEGGEDCHSEHSASVNFNGAVCVDDFGYCQHIYLGQQPWVGRGQLTWSSSHPFTYSGH